MKDRSRSLKTLIFLSVIYDAFALSTIGTKYNNPYPEWLKVLDKEYLTPPDALTWQDAWNFCKDKGGKLAEPKTLQDAADVQDIAMVYGDCCMGGGIWLGIIGNSGHFEYASDWSDIVFSNWDPYYNNTEHLGIGYVRMSYFYTDEYERFRWTNGNWQIGNSKATFVCEREATPPSLPEAPASSSSILVITGKGYGVDPDPFDNDYSYYLSPEVINLAGKTCSRMPDQYPRKMTYGATGGYVNGQVIICGGYDEENDEYLKECYSLKKGESTWTLLGNLQEGRKGATSIVLFNSLYVIGGYKSDGISACTYESISIDGKVNQIKDSKMNPCVEQSSVTIDWHTFFFVGPKDQTYYYEIGEVCQIAPGCGLSNGPKLPRKSNFPTFYPYSGAATGLLRDKDTDVEYIAVVGGINLGPTKPGASNYADSLELLKVGDDKWKSGNPLPKKLSYPAAVSIDGDMFLIGGYEYLKGWPSQIYKLSCKSGDCQWTALKRPGTVLPQALRLGRSQMVAVAVPDDFFDCN